MDDLLKGLGIVFSIVVSVFIAHALFVNVKFIHLLPENWNCTQWQEGNCMKYERKEPK